MVVPVIDTDRLQLGIPDAGDADRVHAYAQRNREHIAPWSAAPEEMTRSKSEWRQELAGYPSQLDFGLALRLVFLDRDDLDGPILGRCQFVDMSPMPTSACQMGFDLDRGAQGGGLMFEAVSAAIRFVFEELALHRILANYMPTNERCGRVLRRLGFVPEGYARDWVGIEGQWRDHILSSLVNPANPV